jgi:RNA-binding protein
MERLSGSARKYLRGLAHGRRALVQVGKEGLSPAVLQALDLALGSHELVKVQFLSGREEKRELAAANDEALGSECVGIIGHMAVFYRRCPDEEKRKITVPGR